MEKEQKHAPLHENITSLSDFRKRREELKFVEENPTCRVAACDNCGNNSFLICLENEVEKYDRNLICSKCFTVANEQSVETLAEIFCKVDFEADFDLEE